MQFSYNWLRELVEELQTPPAELAQSITMKTAESEGVEPYGEHCARVLAVRVESAEPIGETHNRRVTIDAGRHGKHTVVCGAPNCRAGMITAWVPPGTKLAGREIGVAAIGGVESAGMLASGAELGFNRDGGGIIELAVEPGILLPGCSPDYIIEIDNKSLTHRPDLWGHFGMAREVAAISGLRLRDPVKQGKIPADPAPIEVRIERPDLCRRYSALVFENVTVRPSPVWLQYRLQAIGLNPINNVVDVTNYVMAELAQPMHAFDAEKLHGGIIVRTAVRGERIEALNGETYTLTPQALVIADEREAIALAGIIGGGPSAISESSTRIVLESANFDAVSIRKTSARLKLRTDASMRFEKSQDPINTMRGLARAVALLEDVSPGIRLVGGLADAYFPAPERAPLELSAAWISRKLGKHVAAGEAAAILRALDFGAEADGDRLVVTVPSWRATKDVTIPDDIVEEVGRLIGYGAITPTAPLGPAVVPPENKERRLAARLRTMLAAQGYTEVYNYSFVSEEAAAELGFELAAHVRVANPIASDQSLMRASLLPGIVRNLRQNQRHFDTFRLFEVGREIHPQTGGALPREIPMLAAAVFGENDAIFEAKRAAECLLKGVEVRPGTAPRAFEHPARTAELLWHSEVVGRIFELHPRIIEGRAAIIELNLQQVLALDVVERRYTPAPRYPASAFDLSVIAPEREYASLIERRIAMLAGEHLREIQFVRVYTGPQAGEGNKSVSFRVTVGARDRTLSTDEITSIRNAIISGMRAHGYDLRV